MNTKQLESFQLSDAISLHDKLNPKLFVNNKPRIEVKQQLLKIAKDFISELGIKDLDVKDITISGSNAAYTYTPHSDLDLHILVDMAKLPNDEVYKELFNAKKTIYNDTHDIKIHGVPVELYVQDSAEPVVSLGEYSLMKNKWLRIPVKRRASFDQNITKSKYNKLYDLIKVALKSKSSDKVSELLKTLRRYRQVGLDKAGEFSPENLAYKALRSQGWLTKLYTHRDQLHSKGLSIESMYKEDYNPNGPPPGPEFKPTMPAGTVKVDVSDVYDWYKLGQHISNMKGLGKHDFGKGPPSTILSFGDEDTEHKYINDLEKTGLTTTDIDPIDPKQPKGMKKQKVDPTYNVNEKSTKLKESVNTKDEIYNYPKLDRILKKISDLVIKGQDSDKDYGMVGAGVLDSDNRLVARLNYPVSKGKRVHAERAAIEAYESKYGTLPEDCIIITTLSPCNEYGTDMADGREGESCTDYLNSKGIKKVYCGYRDPSQHNDNREFNIIETSDKNLRKLCKQFADTFLKNDISESTDELIQEGISPIVYHYTRAITARNILSTGKFQLSSTLGSVEEQYAPKGYPYFLSTTRSRRGGYHDSIGSDAVLFVLDGTWYSRHYKGAPVDYWLNRDPLKSNHRAHEAEDRIFSKDPTMSAKGVTAIHIYISPDAEPQTRAWARQDLILAKRAGIPAYFYTDKDAWRNQDTRKLGDVSILKGQDTTRGYVSSHKGYLIPWIELVNAKDKSQLSKKANSLRYSLQYSYDKESAAQGLANDLSNARKPNSGPDREHAVSIIKYMQANKLNTVKDLVNNLTDKWKSVEKVDESASGYIPSESEKNDPRYKTALTVDVKPDTLKKNAKAFGFKVSRSGIPPLLRADK
jgi:pyrimidine deaminase RibD-like protein